jgi:HEAT repeat protein
VRSDPEFVQALIGVFRQKSMEVNVEAVEALVWLGAPVLPQLLQALGDPDSGVRFHAAKALGEIGDGRAVAALVGMLGHSAWHLRAEAAESLGQIGGRRVLEPLVHAWMVEEDDRVRERLEEVLQELPWRR